MNRDISVNVEFLTRVEGHGHIVVDMKNGKLDTCQLQIVEAPRFFEAMLKGRSVFEAQHITSRICGICACGHSLASIQAAEAAIGFTPSNQTVKLRKLLLHMENLDSHLLHIYMLAAPDLLGAKSAFQLLATHGDVVRRALRMKKTCNDVCDVLVGRHVHPISSVVGGFTKLPDEKGLQTMLDQLLLLQKDMEPTIELAASLKFPEFERDTEYVGLVSDDSEYPLLIGDVGSTDGVRKHKDEYKEITNEFLVSHSSAKHAKLSRDSYAVGALARFNLNYDKLNPKAKAVAESIGFLPKVTNPYLNTVAQLIECIHCNEEAIEIVKHFLERGVDQSETVLVGLNENNAIPVKAGSGVGAVEVPRGILFHQYDVDDKGMILKANCVIPTGQNLQNIEDDMVKLVPEIAEKDQDEITLALEMLVRAYDPCISCSTHFLEVEFK